MIRMVSPSSVGKRRAPRTVRHSERDPSGLVDRMIGVGTRDGKRISQHAARLLEGYLVLPGIRSSLMRIPGYPHRPILRCRCFLPLLRLMPAPATGCQHPSVDASSCGWQPGTCMEIPPAQPSIRHWIHVPRPASPGRWTAKSERHRQLSARATPRRGLSYSEGGREAAPGVLGALIERGLGRLVARQ